MTLAPSPASLQMEGSPARALENLNKKGNGRVGGAGGMVFLEILKVQAIGHVLSHNS